MRGDCRHFSWPMTATLKRGLTALCLCCDDEKLEAWPTPLHVTSRRPFIARYQCGIGTGNWEFALCWDHSTKLFVNYHCHKPWAACGLSSSRPFKVCEPSSLATSAVRELEKRRRKSLAPCCCPCWVCDFAMASNTRGQLLALVEPLISIIARHSTERGKVQAARGRALFPMFQPTAMEVLVWNSKWTGLCLHSSLLFWNTSYWSDRLICCVDRWICCVDHLICFVFSFFLLLACPGGFFVEAICDFRIRNPMVSSASVENHTHGSRCTLKGSYDRSSDFFIESHQQYWRRSQSW